MWRYVRIGKVNNNKKNNKKVLLNLQCKKVHMLTSDATQ